MPTGPALFELFLSWLYRDQLAKAGGLFPPKGGGIVPPKGESIFIEVPKDWLIQKPTTLPQYPGSPRPRAPLEPPSPFHLYTEDKPNLMEGETDPREGWWSVPTWLWPYS